MVVGDWTTGAGIGAALCNDSDDGIRRTCSACRGGSIDASAREAPRLERIPEEIGPSAPTSAAGASSPRGRSRRSLGSSTIVLESEPFESIEPIVSIAPPSMSVSSLMVADVDMECERDGDLLGLVGPASDSDILLSGE